MDIIIQKVNEAVKFLKQKGIDEPATGIVLGTRLALTNRIIAKSHSNSIFKYSSFPYLHGRIS